MFLAVIQLNTMLFGKNGYSYSDSFGILDANANIMFESKVKAWDAGQMLWFLGVGVSSGYQFQSNGKVGANVIFGFEYAWANKPVSIQLDYRPGYGALLNRHQTDWGLMLSIR